MEIAYMCHYFYPEMGAPSARIYEMAREWVKRGHRTKVITCFPNHPTGIIPDVYRGKLFQKDEVSGIEVYRSYVFATPNRGFFRKILGHLSFMVSSVLFSLWRIGKVDVIVVSSPTLFAAISAYIFGLVKRAPFVFEVRDLWPAIFVDLGIISNGWVIVMLEKLEMFLYNRSIRIVVVTEAFKDNLTGRGIEPSKITVITNGADIDFFYPREDNQGIREELELNGKFLILYLGAHGISHGLRSVLETAELFREDQHIHFVFVGEGAERATLKKCAEERMLLNVSFIGEQPKPRVPLFYAAADVCLVPLRNVELFKGFIPSKIFEIMASGKPIIASVQGEAESILRRSGAALVIPPEDPPALARSILKLRDDHQLRAAMEIAGREFVVENYSRQLLARRYEELLQEITTTDDQVRPARTRG